MHHLKNKNTKTMYIIYIYIYQSIPVPRICMRTHVQETSVSVWLWQIKDAFSALAAWASAPLCILKRLKTLEKILKHLQVLRPKDRIYFKHLKDHQNSSKPSDLDVCFMNHFAGHLHWIKTSRIFQDHRDPLLPRFQATSLVAGSRSWSGLMFVPHALPPALWPWGIRLCQVDWLTVIVSDSATCLLHRHRASLRGFILQRFLQRHVESQPQ